MQISVNELLISLFYMIYTRI